MLQRSRALLPQRFAIGRFGGRSLEAPEFRGLFYYRGDRVVKYAA
jgi:hypothetical protein